MSVKQIVKEAMDRNPINMKEALQEELRSRVAEAVEKRINEASKYLKKGDYVSHMDNEKVGKVTGVSGDKESVDVKWNDGEFGSYDAEELKLVKEDSDAELNEASNPTWEAKIGNKTYKVKAKNTFEANKKAQKMADKEGNAGSPNGKIKKVDESAELEEAKSVDDFMKLFKLKDEPEEGKRMNLGGYPFDYDGFEEDEIYLVAVDSDAAKGLEKEFKKKGFNAMAKNQEVTVMVDAD